jgi:hypothetical protein
MDSKNDRVSAILSVAPWWWWEAQPSTTTTMIIIGIILGFVRHPRCRTDRFYDAPITPYARSDLALPAAVAGYHAALGLAHIGVPAEGWRQAIAVAGAIIVAATAWARMALAAPRPTPDKALPPA